MKVTIFDVEHGACALLACDNGARMLIDCGHNATTGWKPGGYLASQGVRSIDMLAVTNYDEDHVSGIEDLFNQVAVRSLLRNKSVSASGIRKLKSEDGMGHGIAVLVAAIEQTFTGGTAPEPPFAGVERRVHCNQYPAFDDENNLSMVLFLKCNGVGVMFPGDLEKAGWAALLKDAAFQQTLQETNVLVASHHGRESGCCEEIFAYCKPFYVVISDKGYVHETQETIPFYRRFVKGGPFREETTRQVLTTRNDGAIEFNFRADGGWGPA